MWLFLLFIPRELIFDCGFEVTDRYHEWMSSYTSVIQSFNPKYVRIIKINKKNTRDMNDRIIRRYGVKSLFRKLQMKIPKRRKELK